MKLRDDSIRRANFDAFRALRAAASQCGWTLKKDSMGADDGRRCRIRPLNPIILRPPMFRTERPATAIQMAYMRGEPRVCSMVQAPSPEEEDRRRIGRERKQLIAERVEHVNRIKGSYSRKVWPTTSRSTRIDAGALRNCEPAMDSLCRST